MTLFRVIALILMVLALLVALGAVILTTWNVWMIAAFVAWLLDGVVSLPIRHA